MMEIETADEELQIVAELEAGLEKLKLLKCQQTEKREAEMESLGEELKQLLPKKIFSSNAFSEEENRHFNQLLSDMRTITRTKSKTIQTLVPDSNNFQKYVAGAIGLIAGTQLNFG